MVGRRLRCDPAPRYRRRLAGRQEHASGTGFSSPVEDHIHDVIRARRSRHRGRLDREHCRSPRSAQGIRVRRNERNAIAERSAARRGSFVMGGQIELDASGSGSNVTGSMTYTDRGEILRGAFTVDSVCTRTTDGGLILIGGPIIDRRGVPPMGTSRMAPGSQSSSSGSPVKGTLWTRGPDPSDLSARRSWRRFRTPPWGRSSNQPRSTRSRERSSLVQRRPVGAPQHARAIAGRPDGRPAHRPGSTPMTAPRRERMTSSSPVARPVAARAAIASILVSIVTGCTGVAVSIPPASVEPSAIGVASASPPLPTPVAFPTALFAAISEDPVPEGVAAKFQAALDDMAVGGDRSHRDDADGTWSRASGTADGVHDMQPDSQFGIASGTKPIIAAQVMQLVEAGEVSLDAHATEYLPADFTFDTNGATIRS